MFKNTTKWRGETWVRAVIAAVLAVILAYDGLEAFRHHISWLRWFKSDGFYLLFLLGFVSYRWVIPIQFILLVGVSWIYLNGKALTVSTLMALPLEGKAAVLGSLVFGVLCMMLPFTRKPVPAAPLATIRPEAN